MFGAVFIVGGIIGSAVYGIWVEKKRNYKQVLILMSFLSSKTTGKDKNVVFGVMGIMFAFILGNAGLAAFFCFIVGLNMIPVMVIGFEFGVEITYPMGESMSSGILMSMA